ncbi:hypothetical protein Salat_2442600 [Sesamum alatum]|uniref:RNase H type-1 domain-containing protein n=1 Tax=Sesamum alatum TaxID=300844 RepID=A0AAE1XYD3_9LAMI|nr:hypothetical protein Salat_2442600 [Sesamum alatum]
MDERASPGIQGAFIEARNEHATTKRRRHLATATKRGDKINFDGSVFSSSNAMGVGMLARSDTGDILVWRTRHFPHAADLATAKALALRDAVQMALEKEWRNVIVGGGCLPIINRMVSVTEDN